jgi:activating signal cointegrator 1
MTAALTLHQPWASLIALGVKTIETRSWPCPPSLIGQPLAIHAGASEPELGLVLGEAVVVRHGDGWYVEEFHDQRCGSRLPLGAVVATCRVATCVPIVRDVYEVAATGPCMYVSASGSAMRVVKLADTESSAQIVATDQVSYGDFTPGRYAWLLEDVKPTTERCPWCWGLGSYDLRRTPDVEGPDNTCPSCDGAGHCPPVPAKGRQRVWEWSG